MSAAATAIFTAAAMLAAVIAASGQPCLAGGDYVVHDLWDIPHTIESICNGQETLLFLCDLNASTCREGAVYFDSQSDSIKAAAVRPICVFIGKPIDVRQIVLNLDLKTPVYIDEDGLIYENLLDQKVLPALILLGETGSLIRIIYGGGESLDHNLWTVMPLRAEDDVDTGPLKSRRWLWVVVLVSAAAVAALILALG
jgi:hypothetical protein